MAKLRFLQHKLPVLHCVALYNKCHLLSLHPNDSVISYLQCQVDELFVQLQI